MKRLDIKIENLVRLIENDDSVCFVPENPGTRILSFFTKKNKSKDSFNFDNSTFNGIKSFMKHAHNIGSGEFGTCYERFGLVFKFSNEFLKDYQRESNDKAQGLQGYKLPYISEYNRDHPRECYVNEYIQEQFERHQGNFIYNSPPVAYIYYLGCKVGVIYKYHKDYKAISNLVYEDIESIIDVLVNLGHCKKELEDNGIYYNDWKAENILYNGTDVKIIDLDCQSPDILVKHWNSPENRKHDSDPYISLYTPEEQKSFSERKNIGYYDRTDILRRVLIHILYTKISTLTNNEDLDDFDSLFDYIYECCIENCTKADLLEVINNYIQTNKKNRTR